MSTSMTDVVENATKQNNGVKAFKTIIFQDTLVQGSPDKPVEVVLTYQTQEEFCKKRKLTVDELTYVKNQIDKELVTHEAAKKTALASSDHESITRANKAIKYLNRALHQIAIGEYGICGACGETINVGRQLKCIHSPNCYTCKSKSSGS